MHELSGSAHKVDITLNPGLQENYQEVMVLFKAPRLQSFSSFCGGGSFIFN